MTWGFRKTWGSGFGSGSPPPGGGGGGSDPMAGVTQDSASMKYVPASAAQWTTAFTAVGQPGMTASNLQLCQEASGNLADSIGSMTLTTTGIGVSYNNPITGWNRTAAGVVAGAGIRGWDTSGGPNAAATSIAMLVYASVVPIGGTRTLMNLNEEDVSFTTEAWINFSDTNNMIVVSGAGTTATGATDYSANTLNDVIPLLFVNDRTNSRIKLYSPSEAVSGTYVNITNNGRRGLGGGQYNLSSTARYLYTAWFSGATAEWLSTTANAKSLLTTLNWATPGL